MTVQISNESPVTFNVTAGNVYSMTFPNGYDLTIANNSDGELYVSPENEFDFNGDVGLFLTIPSYTAVFNYTRVIYERNVLYFKANGTGRVSVIQN